MQSTQGSMLQSLHFAQAFLNRNAETPAAVVKTGARKQLANPIAALSEMTSRATLPVAPPHPDHASPDGDQFVWAVR